MTGLLPLAWSFAFGMIIWAAIWIGNKNRAGIAVVFFCVCLIFRCGISKELCCIAVKNICRYIGKPPIAQPKSYSVHTSYLFSIECPLCMLRLGISLERELARLNRCNRYRFVHTTV